MTIKELMDTDRFGDIYVLSRYMYRVGEPIITDYIYDKLQEEMMNNRGTYPGYDDYFGRTYDDDPIPLNLLEELGIKPVYAVPVEGREELYQYLNEDKSMSIKPLTDVSLAYKHFMWLKSIKQNFIMSLKVDGVNTKMLYLDDKFRLSLSRGRSGDSFDYTDNSAKVMPEVVDTGMHEFRVWGESYVDNDVKGYLQGKYKKQYATAKSSAISMLRVKHDLEDYRYLHTLVFSAPGLANTQHETFEILREKGISTVPYMVIDHRNVPSDYEEFKEWLDEKLDTMHEMGTGIPSDGVVVEIDDLAYEPEIHGQYMNTQVALKMMHWSFDYYVGVIRNIRVEQRRVYQAVTVDIEPMQTKDGCNAKVINTFNPSLLIDNGLTVGSKVYFEKNSGAVNIMLHGDKLQRLLEGDEVDGAY